VRKKYVVIPFTLLTLFLSAVVCRADYAAEKADGTGEFLFGVSVAAEDLAAGTPSGNAIKQYFDIAFPEGSVTTHAFVTVAGDNGIPIAGGALLRCGDIPDWLDTTADNEAIAKGIGDYIGETVTSYNDVPSWVVVSDAFADTARDANNWRACLRQDPWQIDEEYLKAAFIAANIANPDAVLYYEDINIQHPTKSIAIYNMIKELKEAGVPIGGVVLRGEFNLTDDIANLEAALKLFSGLNVVVSLSLTDAAGYEAPDATGYRAYQIARLFETLAEYDNTNNTVGYVITDGFSPFLTENFEPAPAYQAALDPEKFITDNPDAAAVKAYKMFAVAEYELPLITNSRDPIWDKAVPFNINGHITEDQSAKARASVLWNSEFLFVLVEVEDKILNDSSLDPYSRDGVTVYINESASYSAEDSATYQVSYRNAFTLSENAKTSGFLSSAYIVDGGYAVQMQIPLKKRGYSHNSEIGFDIQVVNAQNGEIISVARWNDVSGAPADPAHWGKLILHNNRNRHINTLSLAEDGLQTGSRGQPFHIKVVVACSVVILMSAMCALIFSAKKTKEVK